MSPASEERGNALKALGDTFASVAEAMLDRGVQLEEALSVFEARYLRQALKRHGGNVSQAAVALGIHRNTLRQKLQRNGVRPTKSR